MSRTVHTLSRPTRWFGVTGTQRVAAWLTFAMATIYLLIYAGVLSVGRAAESDLGILGLAGGIFVVLAVLLARVRRTALWVGVAVLQLLMGAMYIAIAPERDPSFEVWGLTLRVLSLALVVVLVRLLLDARRHEGGS